MNIALTSLYLPSGSKIGVGYQVHGLANALVGRGHRVTVFSPCRRAEDAAYDVHQVPSPRRLRTFGFAWQLRGVDWSAFDVLNAHGDDWFLVGKRRPRHVHTYHGSCLAEMIHAPTWAGRARMGALAACEYNSLLLADETVAVSENTRRYIPGIRHVIPCGLDTAAYRPSKDKSDEPTLLFVGTMHGRKRGRMLVDVFRRQVRPRVKNAMMWCVCDRPDDMADGDGVTFMGRVDAAALTDLYRRAWVFCLPSSYEGFGVPYIEAMASGTAVVASPNVGAREVLGDGQWGIISDDAGLGEQIVALLEDSGRREQLAGAGLERSRAFSWDVICQRYEALYAPADHSPPASD